MKWHRQPVGPPCVCSLWWAKSQPAAPTWQHHCSGMNFCSERGWYRSGYRWHSNNRPHQAAVLILHVGSRGKGAKLTQITPLGHWTLRADEKLPLSLLWLSTSPALHGSVPFQAIFSSHVMAGRAARDDGGSGRYQEREPTLMWGL